MQTQGSLQESNLAALLQIMQSERATGTLLLDHAGTQCSLFFLFGHLFHATDANRQGEDVVIDALGWTDGTYQFDPRAKLPAEETIKSSPDDLVAAATSRTPAGVAAAAPAAPLAAEVPPADSGSGWGVRGGTDEPHPETAAWAPAPEAPAAVPVDEMGWPAAAPAAPAAETPAWTPEPAPTWDAAAQPAAEPAWEAPAVPEVAAAEAPPQPAADVAPEPEPAPAAAPEPEPEPEPVAVAPAPAPEPPPARAPVRSAVPKKPAASASDTVPDNFPLLLPAGKATYEGLKSAFVDFPKLLRTLRADQHTGYVHLQDEGFAGTLVFRKGDVIEVLAHSAGQVRRGGTAFQLVRKQMDAGTGQLDVVDLPEDVVAALGQMFVGQQMFSGLMGRFVDFDALIEYLAEAQVTGSLVVADASALGVILFRNGQPLGAYTENDPAINGSLNAVAGLAKERPARIEVRRGSGDVSGIDVETELSRPL